MAVQHPNAQQQHTEIEDDAKAQATLLQLRRTNASLPALSLPHELLSAILEFACDVSSPLDARQKANRSIRRAISSTCYHWRSLATSTTSLWCDISASAKWMEDPISPPLSYLELEIKRAGERPLKLSFAGTGKCPEAWREFLLVARRVSHQCESIHIVGAPVQGLRDMFVTAPGEEVPRIHLPRLRTLYLRFPSPLKSWPAPLDLTSAPGLKHLSLGTCRPPLKFSSPNNLTKLFGGFSVGELAFLLQECQHLRELRWNFYATDITTSEYAELSSVGLSSLERLSFCSRNTEVGDVILRCLRATQLRYLTLQSSSIPTWNQFPNLQSLCLGWLGGDLIMEILRAVPSIRELVLPHRLNDVSLSILSRAMLLRDEQGALEVVPLLTGLTMCDLGDAQWAEEVLSARNDGQPEALGMRFTLHVPYNSWYEDFNAFRPLRPWSIDCNVVSGANVDDDHWTDV